MTKKTSFNFFIKPLLILEGVSHVVCFHYLYCKWGTLFSLKFGYISGYASYFSFNNTHEFWSYGICLIFHFFCIRSVIANINFLFFHMGKKIEHLLVAIEIVQALREEGLDLRELREVVDLTLFVRVFFSLLGDAIKFVSLMVLLDISLGSYIFFSNLDNKIYILNTFDPFHLVRSQEFYIISMGLWIVFFVYQIVMTAKEYPEVFWNTVSMFGDFVIFHYLYCRWVIFIAEGQKFALSEYFMYFSFNLGGTTYLCTFFHAFCTVRLLMIIFYHLTHIVNYKKSKNSNVLQTITFVVTLLSLLVLLWLSMNQGTLNMFEFISRFGFYNGFNFIKSKLLLVVSVAIFFIEGITEVFFW